MGYSPNTHTDFKNSARVGSIGNVTIAAPGANIDGIAMAVGERVLLKNQTSGAENGIYEWNGAAVPMTRSRDADGVNELTAGTLVAVEEGTNADKLFIITTDGTIVIDTTPITYAEISGGGGVANLDPAFRRSWMGI